MGIGGSPDLLADIVCCQRRYFRGAESLLTFYWGLSIGFVVWVVSAYVTFLEDELLAASTRRKRNRPVRKSAVRGLDEPSKRRMAVAPPRVGRSRVRRRRIVSGLRDVLRLGPARAWGTASGPLHTMPPEERTEESHSYSERGFDDMQAGALPQFPYEVSTPPRSGRAGLSAAAACMSALGTLCVGQAINPGPAAVLSWVSSAAASAVAYALPGRMGFHGAHTPGFNLDAREPPCQPFTLRMLTANTTGWAPLQQLLRDTQANVVFAQEHRLLPSAIPAASAWARKQGWKTVWAPAVHGSGGGAAAGTVICARAFMGLRHPDRGDAVVVKGRVAAAVVEPPSCRPFVGYSAYYHCGQGLSRANLDITAEIGAHWEAMEDSTLQMVLAADFNMEPSAFARADLSSRIWGRLVVPLTPRGTCRTRTKAATYDYFFMTAPMADLVSDVATLEGTGIRTHAPTSVTFHPRLASLKALAIRAPPALPVDEVYGPRLPPPPWEGVLTAAEELVSLVRDGAEYSRSEQMLSDIYGLWLDHAERELADITGTELARYGRRKEGPRFAWRSILPEVSRSPPTTGAAAFAWLADIARDATRLNVPIGRRQPDDVDDDGLVKMLLEALHADIDGKHFLEHDGSLADVRRILERAELLIRPGANTSAEDWASWSAELERRLEQLRTKHGQLVAQEAGDRLRGWREWLRKGFESGAKNAHAYMRLPSEWRPTSAKLPSGRPTAEPARILDDQRSRYAAAWKADDDQGSYRWPVREALPRISPSEFREASRSFKKTTAVAYDGIHCRHYSLLCDEALETLGALLETCELLGTLPKQSRLVVTPLLEKPKGGFRPIAIYVSLYRLWAKTRRGAAVAWEASHSRSYFSSSKGNGPCDTTWRQGVRQEAQLCRGGAAACLYWDLETFYESIDRSRLLARAESSGFPMPVLRLSLAAYSVPRVLSMEGRISRELWPKRGIGAGCGLANTYVKVYTVFPLDRLITRLPPTCKVDIHIDDLAIECTADDEATVARDIAIAQRLVKEMVEHELGAVISIPKAALVASSRRLATVIRDSVGTLAGPVRQAAANLGVDSTAAKRRGDRATGPLRRARWAKAVSRRHRLKSLAAVVGTKAGKIFTVGVGASAVYHAAVQGLTDNEVSKLRRLAAVVYPPRSRFRSLTLTHLLHDMPTAAAEVAATLQYARAVWSANLLGHREPRHPGFDLPGIRAAWDKVAAGIHEYIDGDNPHPNKRRKWGRSRGPLSAAMLELHRVGGGRLVHLNGQMTKVSRSSSPRPRRRCSR